MSTRDEKAFVVRTLTAGAMKALETTSRSTFAQPASTAAVARGASRRRSISALISGSFAFARLLLCVAVMCSPFSSVSNQSTGFG